MMNNELIKIWKSSSQIEKVKFEKSRLILEMQSSINSIYKKIKFRDLREIAAAIVVIPVFIYYTLIVPHFISKVACVLIVIWACFIVFYLRRARKLEPSAYSENYLTYLEKSKHYLESQKNLLDSIFWWYILPFLFCFVLFEIGFLNASENKSRIIITLIGGLVLSLIIYFFNKRHVKKEFEPRIEKIEELIKAMN